MAPSYQNSGMKGNQEHRSHQMRSEDETETERNLDHYEEQARLQEITANTFTEMDEVRDEIDEVEDLYVNTTSECHTKSKVQEYAFNSVSQDRKEMSFSQRLEDTRDLSRE